MQTHSSLAPTPWTAAHDGHGGVCLDDANGRQIGFLSSRPEQDAHAALFKAAPHLLTALQHLMDAPKLGTAEGMRRARENAQRAIDAAS